MRPDVCAVAWQELRDLWMKGRNGSNLGLHL